MNIKYKIKSLLEEDEYEIVKGLTYKTEDDEDKLIEFYNKAKEAKDADKLRDVIKEYANDTTIELYSLLSDEKLKIYMDKALEDIYYVLNNRFPNGFDMEEYYMEAGIARYYLDVILSRNGMFLEEHKATLAVLIRGVVSEDIPLLRSVITGDVDDVVVLFVARKLIPVIGAMIKDDCFKYKD